MPLEILKNRREIETFFGFEPLQSASVRVTRACNLRCKQCYSFAGKPLKNELTLAEFEGLFAQLKALGVVRIFFTGGEPFLRKDMPEVLEAADREGFACYISSNGTPINGRIIAKLDRLEHLKNFQVSIDGLDGTHDQIRGRAGSFTAAINAVRLAVTGLRRPKKVVVCTLLPDNLNQIEELVGTLDELHLDSFCLVPLYPVKREEGLHDVSTEDKHAALERLTKLRPRNLRIAVLTAPAIIPHALQQTGSGCGYLCSFPSILGIDADGSVAPCDGLLDHPPSVLGNVRDSTLEELWQHKLMRELRDIQPHEIRGVCGQCEHIEFCAGGCRARAFLEYGDFRAPNPLCQAFADAGFLRPAGTPKAANES